jgi:hypothetical protein
LPASSQRTSALTGETMESTYSLVSSAVEGLELRQQLAAMQLKLGAPPAWRLLAASWLAKGAAR